MGQPKVEDILRLKIKPKAKQAMLVEAVISGHIPIEEFIAFFEAAGNVDKGSCADALKHIAVQKPELLAPYINLLIGYINYPLPRVKWGIPEAIGNLAKVYGDQAVAAIPYLQKNTTDNPGNTTVIKWCAAFALVEIAKYNLTARNQLLPFFEDIANNEKNQGVRNLYNKAIKMSKAGS